MTLARVGRTGPRRWIAGAAVLLLALALGWGAGLIVFLLRVNHEEALPPRADGIVALTGGAERVDTALRLLGEGRAPRLLVSGVAPATELREMARRAKLDPGPLAEKVTLGHEATSTHGNAVETAEWVRTHDIHSLIVVTAAYHMPRALAELRAQLPQATLFAAAVTPPALRGGLDTGTARLIAVEYTKWLGVELGLSRIIPSLPQRGRGAT